MVLEVNTTLDSLTDDIRDLDLYQWVQLTNLFEVLGFVLALVGFVMNTFCYLTANQLPESSSASLIKHLAIFDSLAALQDGVINMGMKAVAGVDLANINLIGCKLFFFNSWGSGLAATYHTVAIALDRVIVIKIPFWHREHIGTKGSGPLVKLSCIIAAVSYLYSLQAFRVMNMSIGVCGVGYNTLSHPIFHDLLQWGSAVVLGVIPVSVLIGCNFVFARALFNREKQMSKRDSKGKLKGDAKKDPKNDKNKSNLNNPTTSNVNTRGAIQRQKEQNKRNYITMLLFMTTAYLFCVFMFFATTAIRRNTVEVEKKMMLLTFGELWLIMNNSTNFLFYFMSGQAFRKAFRKAIHMNKSGKADENVELSSRTRETTQK